MFYVEVRGEGKVTHSSFPLPITLVRSLGAALQRGAETSLVLFVSMSIGV